MAKNIYSLQLLRNGVAYADKNAAYKALESASGLTNVTKKDGVAVLARYVYEKDENKEIRTLVGYYAEASAMTETSGATSYMTIIDVEGAAADVEELRNMIGSGVTTANTVTKQLQDLSGDTASTSADTSVEGAKKYADEKVAEELSKLSATTQSGESKVIIDVTQDNGKITTTSANLTGVKLDGYSEGSSEDDIAATDSLGTALGKLQHQINGMDLEAVGAEGSVITSVSEEDGKVSATATPVKDVKLTGYVKDTTKTGDIAATDDIEDALSKLENKAAAITIKNDDGSINVTTGTSGTNINVNVKSGEKVIKKDGNGGLYTDLDLVKITENLPTTVKERYQLLASDDSQIGVNIDIAKDSHIVSITYITDTGDTHYQNLEYKYIDASGDTQTEYVDISSLVLEAEFASGITVTNHIAHGVVDPTSETNSGGTAFLTVGADGFKVAGIKQEIIDRINELDATVGDTTVATGNHVAVQVVEADGKLTAVTVSEDNIANADDLAELSAKTVTEIESSNNSISATSAATSNGTVKYDVITDASKIQMSGFTNADVLSGIAESSSITEAFLEVDKVITENEETVSAALNDLEATKAEKTALEAEIAARKAVDGQNGDTYVANASAKYISGATSLNDADLKLDAAIANITTGFIEGIQVNGTDLEEINNKVNVQIIPGTTATDTPNAINVATDGTTGAITLTLGTLDCGTY